MTPLSIEEVKNIIEELQQDTSPEAMRIKEILEESIQALEQDGTDATKIERLREQERKLIQHCTAIKKRRKKICNIVGYPLITGSMLFADWFLKNEQLKRGIDASTTSTIIHGVILATLVGFVAFLWKKMSNFFSNREEDLLNKAEMNTAKAQSEIFEIKTQLTKLEHENNVIKIKLDDALHILDAVKIVSARLLASDERLLELAKEQEALSQYQTADTMPRSFNTEKQDEYAGTQKVRYFQQGCSPLALLRALVKRNKKTKKVLMQSPLSGQDEGAGVGTSVTTLT